MYKYLLIFVLLVSAVAARAAEPGLPVAAGAGEFKAGWREVVAPVPNSQGKGVLQARQEALTAAIPHFTAAVSADSKNVSYRIALGYVYLSAGKYQQANDTLLQATERNRNNPLPYLLRAQAEAALAFMTSVAEVGAESPSKDLSRAASAPAPPPTAAAKEIDTALRSFDHAADLDPTNSLPLIQAASVAFEVGRQEVALAKLQAALQRPGMTLYRLPIPGDLDPSKSASIRMWQNAQMLQWLELLARCQNAARMMVKYGKQKEDAGDLDGAEAAYGQVLALGKQVGSSRPNVFVSVNSGINIMEDAYASLVHLYEPYPLLMKGSDWSSGREADDHAVVRGSVKNVSTDPLNGVTAVVQWQKADGALITSAEALVADQPILPGKSSPFEVTTSWNPAMDHPSITFKSAEGGIIPHESGEFSPERQTRAAEKRSQVGAWKGESGVLYIGRSELFGALEVYAKSIDDDPPASIDDTLDREAQITARVMLGVGLSPTHKPPPQWGTTTRKKASGAPSEKQPERTAPGSASGQHR